MGDFSHFLLRNVFTLSFAQHFISYLGFFRGKGDIVAKSCDFRYFPFEPSIVVFGGDLGLGKVISNTKINQGEDKL